MVGGKPRSAHVRTALSILVMDGDVPPLVPTLTGRFTPAMVGANLKLEAMKVVMSILDLDGTEHKSVAMKMDASTLDMGGAERRLEPTKASMVALQLPHYYSF